VPEGCRAIIGLPRTDKGGFYSAGRCAENLLNYIRIILLHVPFCERKCRFLWSMKENIKYCFRKGGTRITGKEINDKKRD